MYKFTGSDTSGKINYALTSKAPIDLYNQLVNRGIIATVDGDPLEIYKLSKVGKTFADFWDTDAYELNEKLLNQTLDSIYLTDAEILRVIGNERGNAYYQEIEEV